MPELVIVNFSREFLTVSILNSNEVAKSGKGIVPSFLKVVATALKLDKALNTKQTLWINAIDILFHATIALQSKNNNKQKQAPLLSTGLLTCMYKTALLGCNPEHIWK